MYDQWPLLGDEIKDAEFRMIAVVGAERDCPEQEHLETGTPFRVRVIASLLKDDADFQKQLNETSFGILRSDAIKGFDTETFSLLQSSTETTL